MLPGPPAGEVWLGDDTAVLAGGTLLATDLMAEGVHFDLAWTDPASVGWKALAVNCSDLAAMGGTPRAAVAAVLVPAGRPGLADALGAGLAEAAAAFGCPLVGGDTAVGEALVVTVAVLGDAPPGGAVLRSGARPGDTVFVTSHLGGPRVALAHLRPASERGSGGWGVSPDGLERLHRPTPRLAEGRAAAAGGATAMIDLSDGLSSDLAQVCTASGAGAVLEADRIPLGAGARLQDALAGGDDYELCFTAPDPGRILAAFAADGLMVPWAIGRVFNGSGLTLRFDDGTTAPLPAVGFEHPVP